MNESVQTGVNENSAYSDETCKNIGELRKVKLRVLESSLNLYVCKNSGDCENQRYCNDLKLCGKHVPQDIEVVKESQLIRKTA